MKFEFSIQDLPPKKDGANSMWRKHSELVRLGKLRIAAAAAFCGKMPLSKNIHLTLTVHIPTNTRLIGDLDNFVTGVLDGLQAAAKNTPWESHVFWSDPQFDHCRPNCCIAIKDDCEVLQINAGKVVGESEHAWYEVVLEGE